MFAQRFGHVADAGFQRCLGQSHGVVIGNGPAGTEVGQCKRGGTRPHQMTGRLDHGRVAVRGNVVGDFEIFPSQAIEEISGDGFAGGEAN